MARLTSFNFITLNGFLNGTDGDISWHRHGKEENQYATDSLKANNTLLFGRRTYEMMAAYWPSSMALENDPTVAPLMNKANKIVVSKTLKKTEWEHTRIINGDVVTEIKQLKENSPNDLTILGSGSILTLLTNHALIDEYQIMVDPVAINTGTPVFNGIKSNFNLKLTGFKSFKSGVVLLSYVPYR